MISSTDRIERRILLRAPQEKVWRALSTAREFGRWFGMELNGDFAAGKAIGGRMKPTEMDPEVAAMQEKNTGKPVTLHVERLAPMSEFAFRWHPFACGRDGDEDLSNEPMTLVTFTLAPADGGTMLAVVESGFDGIPIARRASAFEAHQEGWGLQMRLVENYLQLPRS